MDFPTDPLVKLHPSTGDFTDGEPGLGIPASLDRGQDYNQLWKELIDLIAFAGLTPSSADLTQVRQAVNALIAASAVGQATTTTLGSVELATQVEMDAGTDPARVPAVNVIATYVAAQVAALVDASPAALDTLNELAAALGDDANFSTTVNNALALRAQMAVVQAWNAQQYFPETALVDGANVAWNLSTAPAAKLTMAGNRTIDNPTNMQAGAVYTLRLIQDATGGRVPSWGTAYVFGDNGTPTFSTVANKSNLLAFYCTGTQMLLSKPQTGY